MKPNDNPAYRRWLLADVLAESSPTDGRSSPGIARPESFAVPLLPRSHINDRLALLALALGALLLAACTARPADDTTDVPASPRHVFLLTVDTLRADHMSLYGYQRATTPFLEQLAAESVVFERAIVQWPKTGTSFASMFTGRYPQSTGLTHRAALRIPHELPILPELMQQAGFRSVAVVSNAVLSKELGWDRGFDEYVETWAGSDTEDPVEYRALLHAERVNRLALELVDRHLDAERLFVWVHYSDPHAPYILPPERENPFLEDEIYRAADPFEVDLTNTSGKAIGEATDLRFYRAQYDANVLEVDRALRALTDELEQRELLGNGLILFTADHGESLGEHDLYFEHGPLPYSPSARVPLLVKGDSVSADLRIDTPVELLGLVPTLAELVPMLEIPPAMQPQGSRWPLRASAEQEDAVAFAEAGRAGRRHYRTVQDERWKLVFKPPRVGGRPQAADFELYDLENDPLEEHDVLAEESAPVRRLRALLLEWMEETALVADDAAVGDEAGDPEALRALRAMGYVQ